MVPLPNRTSTAELDELTLRRAQHGDARAFADLVTHHEGIVWAFLWQMAGRAVGQSTVEDLFQETFLAVYRALPRFEPDGAAKLRTWILAVATRVVLSWRRTHGREPLDPTGGAAMTDDGDAATQTERRVLIAALDRALGLLSPDHRAVFILREMHGLEYNEISVALDLDIGTVRSRLHRAREALRKAFGEGDDA